jgi:putative acetyltransferase
MPTLTPATVIIRDFDPTRLTDQPAFQSLNEEWINQHFRIEPTDAAALTHPQDKYLDKGGRIFLAFLNEVAVGCCALIQMSPGEFEVSKMGVTKSAQGQGLGRQLLAHTIDEAWKMGAKRLYLETNHVLAPAIHLYETLGFTHVPADRLVPSPYARADVFMEMARPR